MIIFINSQKFLRFHPTCNIAGFVSGYTGLGSKTILPSKAMVKVDFRLVEAQKPHVLFNLLKKHIQREGFKDVLVVCHGSYESAKTPPDDPFVVRVIETAERVYGCEPIVWPSVAGTSPIYVIRNWMGIPVASGGGVGYSDDKIHAPNENVRITDFVNSIKYVTALMLSYKPS